PHQRERLQRDWKPIDHSIARSDRLASILFSANLLGGLALGWIGFLATLVFIIAGLLGDAVGEPNRYVQLGISGFFNLLLASVVLLWIFDAQLASRSTRLRQSRWYRGWLAVLSLPVRFLFPERLLAPLRLTLQSNTWPRVFAVLFLALVVFGPLIGAQYFQRSTGFDPFEIQRFVTTADIQQGARSSHYETQRLPRHRRRGEPIIPAPVIETAWLPLFLPYQPLRDDALIELRCSARVAALAIDATAKRGDAAACLAELWEVRLNSRLIDIHTFVPTERADLGFRGIAGYIDLRASPPGPQQLEVIWRPQPERETLKNDMLRDGSYHYSIPFLWSPESASAAVSPPAPP
ncbi:MAG: hypothetical protein ACT4NL_16315, partial [Pseudomarimonas sp.]